MITDTAPALRALIADRENGLYEGPDGDRAFIEAVAALTAEMAS
jgi:hypothetical protein